LSHAARSWSVGCGRCSFPPCPHGANRDPSFRLPCSRLGEPASLLTHLSTWAPTLPCFRPISLPVNPAARCRSRRRKALAGGGSLRGVESAAGTAGTGLEGLSLEQFGVHGLGQADELVSELRPISVSQTSLARDSGRPLQEWLPAPQTIEDGR